MDRIKQALDKARAERSSVEANESLVKSETGAAIPAGIRATEIKYSQTRVLFPEIILRFNLSYLLHLSTYRKMVNNTIINQSNQRNN